MATSTIGWSGQPARRTSSRTHGSRLVNVAEKDAAENRPVDIRIPGHHDNLDGKVRLRSACWIFSFSRGRPQP